MALTVYYNEEETGQEKALGGVKSVEYINGQFKITYEGGESFWMTPSEFNSVTRGGSESPGLLGGLGGGL